MSAGARRAGAVALLAAAVSSGSKAAGQAFRLNRYAPPPTPHEGLAVPRPATLSPGEFSALAVLEYADDPLVLELESGLANAGSVRLVDRQLQSHLRFAYGLTERWLLSAGAETVLLMTGDSYRGAANTDTFAPADGAGLGDLRAGARYLALDHAVVRLALELEATAPLARAARPSQRLSGARGPTFHPRGLVEASAGPARLTGTAGWLARPNTQAFSTELGDEFTFGAGAGVFVDAGVGSVELLVDVAGATDTGDLWGARSTSLESLAGLRWQGSRLQFGIGGGVGWLRGVGSPATRALVSMAFFHRDEPDSDSDGLLDAADTCPFQAEDYDAFQDDDGCPDRDNDGDGVRDATDRCGGAPEDLDGFQDSDGCPDPDNDHDGQLDVHDRCPDAAEDRDGYQDEDGCPEFDNDGDGLLDAEDACPGQAGTLLLDGCPAAPAPARGTY